MSQPKQRRRFDAVAKPGRAKTPIDAHDAAVAEANHRHARRREAGKAADALFGYARALAGTDAPDAKPRRRKPRPRARPAVEPRPRPDQHTEVPLAEAMTTPWHDGNPLPDSAARPPRPPAGFEAWGLTIPSYERDDPEDDDGPA